MRVDFDQYWTNLMSGFFKNISRSIKKSSRNENSKISKIEKFQKVKIWFLKIFGFLRFWKFSVFPDFFGSIENIFEKVGLEKSGHQYRSKISLRIEREHSQALKTTLKHSSGYDMKEKRQSQQNSGRSLRQISPSRLASVTIPESATIAPKVRKT